MAIALRAVGTGGIASGGSVTPSLPAGTTTNDILVGFVQQARGTNTLTWPAGWTVAFSGNNGSGASGVRIEIAWKRAGASESNPTITNCSSSLCAAVILGFTGCKTSGSPFDAVGTAGTGSSPNISCPSVTPTQVSTYLLMAVGVQDGGSSWGSYSGSDPSPTEHSELGAWGFAVAGGVRSSSSATGARTASTGGSGFNTLGVQLLLAPAASDQTLSPTAIASGAAVGSPTLSNASPQSLTATGIAGAAALGQPALSHYVVQELDPTGIASSGGVGQPALSHAAAQELDPTGIASSATVGQPALSIPSQTLSPTGIASTLTIGHPGLTIQHPEIAPRPPRRTLDILITSLIYGETPAVVLANVSQYTDAEITIPYLRERTAKVTLSVFDRALAEMLENAGGLRAYEHCLFVRYLGQPVFWGPIVTPEWDLEQATVTLNAVDPSVRLQHHYLRLGDDALNSDNGFDGSLPVDHRGLRKLRDAAFVTGPQAALGIPDIGIEDGTNDCTESDLRLRVTRGDEVWAQMIELASVPGRPDFELEPLDISDRPLSYCRLNTYESQGTDRTGEIVWHCGFGADNVANVSWSPGGKVVTQSTVTSQDAQHRSTILAPTVAQAIGVYSSWNARDFNGNDDEVFAAYATGEVQAYAPPPNYLKVTLRRDTPHRYGGAYVIGDTIRVCAKRGFMHSGDIDAAVVQVTLRQADDIGDIVEDVDLEPVDTVDIETLDET